MKKILLILLLLLPAWVFAQQAQPVNPVQVPQTTLYNEPSTGTRWWYNGATLGWYPLFPYSPPNTVLTGLSLTVVSSTLTVHTGTWRINNQDYTLGSNTNFTLQARDSVYSRYETVYATGVNNGIGIKVGVLSPTPIQPSVGADTLIVGAVLITPTATTIIPPGPSNQFVFTQPTVQQSYANPWIRTLRVDTIKIGGHYILPPIDGTSGQTIQTDGAGNLFWSNQAIYLPLSPITISGNNIGIDTSGSTSGVVTHTALMDTLTKNAAHFNPTQFTISNDTISLIGGGGSVSHASNGLSLSGDTVKLGGTLIENTTVDALTKSLAFTGSDGTDTWSISGSGGQVDLYVNNNSDPSINTSFIMSENTMSAIATNHDGSSGTITVSQNSINLDVFDVPTNKESSIFFNDGRPTPNGTYWFIKDEIGGIGLNGAVVFPYIYGTQYAQYSKVDSIAKAKADSVKGTISGGVPTSRTLTINGTTLDLSANRTWAVGDALVANPLSQFASTTSAQLAGVLSDETGTGVAVFSASPALTGTPTVPTASPGTNTTQVASTAFVAAAVAAGGGLSASNFVTAEVPSGSINSSNTAFTLANTPTAGTVKIYRNGQRQIVGTDYTISGTAITYLYAPTTGDSLIADYLK